MEIWVQILIPIQAYQSPKILGEKISTDYKTCKAPFSSPKTASKYFWHRREHSVACVTGADDKNEGSLWNNLEGALTDWLINIYLKPGIEDQICNLVHNW